MLCSLNLQKLYEESCEIIIVDDGSDDGTFEYLRDYISNINLKYIRLKSNMGRAVARNVGIDASTGEILIFTDDDCILSSEFLINHIKNYTLGKITHGAIYNLSFLKFFLDPQRGILYPEFAGRHIEKLKSVCLCERDVMLNFDRIEQMGKVSKFEKVVNLAMQDDERVIPWIGFTGGNVSVAAKSVKKVGGFDEHLGKEWGAEDIELGYRLYKEGLSFHYDKKPSVYHIAHYRMDNEQLSRKAIMYLEKKHKELHGVNLYNDFFDGKFNYRELKRNIRKCGNLYDAEDSR